MFDIKSFYEADSVEDAIAALTADPQSQVISGGTDVLIRVREGKDAGRGLVSIHNIPELKGVSLEEDGTIIIRPATSFSHITNDPIIKKHLSMLGEAVDQVGGPQVRNTATIGGNICNGATSADSASTMCALNAAVVLKGPEGVRKCRLQNSIQAPDVRSGSRMRSARHLRLPGKTMRDGKAIILNTENEGPWKLQHWDVR